MEWLPIESAPKDEDVAVLIWDGDVHVSKWDGNGWTHVDDYEGINGSTLKDTTHWQPLPAAPK